MASLRGNPITDHLDTLTLVMTLGSSHVSDRHTLWVDPFEVRGLRLWILVSVPDVTRFGIPTPTDFRTPGLGMGQHLPSGVCLSFL